MRPAVALVLGVLFAAWALLVWRFDFTCDDAFIAFRYSRNLAEGAGIRFNPGVEPPVEGYSDFGWVVWIGLWIRAGADALVAARITTVAAGAALLAWTVLAMRRAGLGWFPVLSGTAVCALAPPFAVWSTSGLETMVFAMLLFGTWERLGSGRDDNPSLSRTLQAAGLGAAAMLMRPDALWWLGTMIGIATLQGLGRRDRARLRSAALVATAVALVLAAHTIGRLAYYGDWLPNTARAKVGISALTLERGLYYTISFWLAFPATLILPTIALATSWRQPLGLAGQCALVAFATFAYGVASGGDFMCMGRFFVPALPFTAVATAAWLHRLDGSPTRRPMAHAAVWVCTGLSLQPAFDLHVAPRSWRENFHFRWNRPDYVSEFEQWDAMRLRAAEWSLLGRALAQHTQPGDTLVLGAIGAAGYYSHLFIHDRHGLVDREVATTEPPPDRRRSPGHDRTVPPKFFLSRNPTYLAAELSLLPPSAEPANPSVEFIRLREEDGFPRGCTLVLRRP